MIRLIPMDEFEPKELEKLCRMLYAAFGVGCESAEKGSPPRGAQEPVDPAKALAEPLPIRLFRDDKVLYLTSRKLRAQKLPTGAAPIAGYSVYGKERALVSTQGATGLESVMKPVARQALHQLGHLWDLHHCLDPRCAMSPTWTPSYDDGEASFCNFCREKSERRISRAVS